MKISKILILTFIWLWTCSLLGMEAIIPQPSMPSAMIPVENQIKLVFMGKTGAGKSTLINAFYNFAQRVKWDDPKYYVIPTEFQTCNVTEYQGRVVENFSRGQLNAVTQDPSEYISRNDKFVVSLIDCPGMADPRGIQQDITNTAKITEFINRVGGFNAICIVLPVTINRDTAETSYFIQQIKSIIPQTAHKHIFICVSYSTAENINIKDFVVSVGLPEDNIFYFDNFAISKDGYDADTNINLCSNDLDEDDPFADNNSNDHQQKKIAKSCKARDSWLYSNKEFNKLLRKAKSVGRYTSDDMKSITKIKNSVTKKILKAYNKIEAIEKTETKIKDAEIKLNLAMQQYQIALDNKNSSEQAMLLANLEKQRTDALELFDTFEHKYKDKKAGGIHTTCNNCQVACHINCSLEYKGNDINDHLIGCSCMQNNSCTACPKGCPYSVHFHQQFIWKTETKKSKNAGVAQQQKNSKDNVNSWQKKVDNNKKEFSKKEQEKDKKDNILNDLNQRLLNLQNERKSLQQEIVELYVDLGKVSMSSINFHIGEYYDLCIRKETDRAKIAKLNKERDFYTEQVELYKQRTAQNNS